MKAKTWLALAAAVLLMNAGFNPAGSPRLNLLGGAVVHAGVRVDFEFFYKELSPYGDWCQVEPYGWVWYPNVAKDWQPYTIGYWVFTDDYGWIWISTDPWGSIPFHYGRWFYDSDDGWAWVPGTEWGPAWVGWRSGDGFIGWAPLPPEVEFDPSIGFTPSDQDFGIGQDAWCFVPTSRFLSPRIEQAIVSRSRSTDLIDRTTNVTHYISIDRRVVNRSIDLRRFERETHVRVTSHRVDESDHPVKKQKPSQEGRVVLFRPEVVRTPITPPPPLSPPNRPPHLEAPPDHRFDHHGLSPAPEQPPAASQNQRDRGEEPDARRPPQVPPPEPQAPPGEGHGPGPIDFEERNGQSRQVGQERPRQLPEVERQPIQEQHQQAEQERARRWMEQEQRKRAEQERAQQQVILQRQQAEQERAQQQAILQRQQAEQERHRAEQEQAR
ncbi:MAG: DUF6600 domain-containing protein, partial [Candidatus Competibacter sp.]